MEFKIGDRVELNEYGKNFCYFDGISLDAMLYSDNIYKIKHINESGLMYCLLSNQEFGLWLNPEHIELSKRYYRKERIKKLKNEI
jgi:hypothetical protein